MTPTWTGSVREPIPTPEHLRHRFHAIDGGAWARWICDDCQRIGRGHPAPDEEGDLCHARVARRLAELEAHEASLHKHGAVVAGKIAAWLREQAEQEAALARTVQYVDERMKALAAEGALDAAAYAIERGEVVPVGATPTPSKEDQ